MDTKTKHHNLAEAARLVGISYQRLWYYLITKKLPEPERVGRTRLFTDVEVSAIKEYFDARDRESRTKGGTTINL
jgi:DNA-binding transcriptional MerR regulator